MCWTLEPYLFFAIPEIFLYISDNSSLVLVAYLVHECCVEIFVHREKIVLIVRVRQSWVLYDTDCLDCRTEYTNTRFIGVGHLGAPVDNGVMGITRCEWSYNQFAGDCTFKYEEDWGNIIRARAAYILSYLEVYNSELVHDEMWPRYPGDMYYMLSSTTDNAVERGLRVGI